MSGHSSKEGGEERREGRGEKRGERGERRERIEERESVAGIWIIVLKEKYRCNKREPEG